MKRVKRPAPRPRSGDQGNAPMADVSCPTHSQKQTADPPQRSGDSPDHATTPTATVLRPRRVQPGTPPYLPCLATAHTPPRAYPPPRMSRHHTHTRRSRTVVPPRPAAVTPPEQYMNMQTPRHPTRAATGRARRATRAPPPAAAPHSIRGPLDGMAPGGGGEETAALGRPRPCRRPKPLGFSPCRDGSPPEGIGGPPSAARDDALAGASRLGAGNRHRLGEDMMDDRWRPPTPQSASGAAATWRVAVTHRR